LLNKVFLFGIIGGLTVAMGLAVVVSAIATHSTAQMMGHQGMMGQSSQGTTTMPWQWDQRSSFHVNGMSTVNNVQITGVSVTGSNELTVNLRHGGSGASPAVTVIAVTNPMALMQGSMAMGGMGMMNGQNGMMMQQGGQSMMMGGHSGAMPAWQNNTQWQQWHTQMAQWHGQINSTQWAQMQAMHNEMMAQGLMGPGMAWNNGTHTTWPGQFMASQPQTGSNVLDAGWASDTTMKVRIDGDGSAYESNGLHVMVFPLTR
jgi:hypothetical protein